MRCLCSGFILVIVTCKLSFLGSAFGRIAQLCSARDSSEFDLIELKSFHSLLMDLCGWGYTFKFQTFPVCSGFSFQRHRIARSCVCMGVGSASKDCAGGLSHSDIWLLCRISTQLVSYGEFILLAVFTSPTRSPY